MKKYIIITIFFTLISIHNDLYSQQLKNIATGIEVFSVVSNKVMLKWKSDMKKGAFAVYYNTTNSISNSFLLKESTLLINSNFIGENQGTHNEYSYSFELNETGTYFFAVVVDSGGELFDTVARNILLENEKIQKITIIPGINSTIQPIYLQILNNNNNRISNIKKFPTYESGYLITDLSLNSYEDIFQLKWNVYPKNLSQYVFIIYRSRYPIIQYGKPTGLPEYTRVTNKFTFEDRNISYENPYYYAVVAENSIQWDAGINVFTTPAVLLRKSPPLAIKTEIQFIQTQKNLPIDNQMIFTEAELDEAVKQTLKNLELGSNNDTNQNVLALNNTFSPICSNISENLITDNLNLLTLSKQENLAKAKNLFVNTENFKIDKDIFLKNRNIWMSKLSNIILQDIALYNTNIISKKYQKDQELLENDQKDILLILGEINKLTHKLKSTYILENELLNVDYLSLQTFKEKLVKYYYNRDNIKIDQYKINSMIKGFNTRRNNREKKYLSDLKKVEKEEKNKLLLQINTNTISYYLKEINDYVSIYSNAINNQKQDRIDNVSQSIALQVTQKKNKKNEHLDQVNRNMNRLSKRISEVEKILAQLYDKQTKLTNLLIQAKANNNNILHQNNISLIENSINNWNQFVDRNHNTETAETRLKKMQTHYNDVVIVEKVPDLTEIPKETWIHENKEIWLSKKQLWNNRNKQILGDQYSFIQSKWLEPSFDIALQEGQKAFHQKKYHEAIYLLSYVSQDKKALMILGQSYFYLGAYRDAFTVFITAVNMGIPESRYWLDITAEQIIERKIQ